jgi:DNA/RNA endonuclease YhcR with UshA esterase domain
MRSTFLILFLFLFAAANSQQVIKLEEVRQHIGDSVTVCGKVVDGYYSSGIENTPTFLNVGANYPNQLLTIIIWGEARKKFEFKPEEVYKDKQICTTGRITEYKGKPQIVITTPEQLKIEK